MQINQHSLDETTVPCSGMELEKLRLIQLIKKFHACKLTQHHWDLAIPRSRNNIGW
jgi:hypothetical protein